MYSLNVSQLNDNYRRMASMMRTSWCWALMAICGFSIWVRTWNTKLETFKRHECILWHKHILRSWNVFFLLGANLDTNFKHTIHPHGEKFQMLGLIRESRCCAPWRRAICVPRWVCGCRCIHQWVGGNWNVHDIKLIIWYWIYSSRHIDH